MSTTTKAYRGPATLAKWRAEARQRGHRPNVAYFGARFRGESVDPDRRISGADMRRSGNRRKRIIRKMRRSVRTWRRLIRMGTALGSPFAPIMNPLLQQLAEIEERRIARLHIEERKITWQHREEFVNRLAAGQQQPSMAIGYSVLETHEETVNGRPVRVIDRIDLQSISPILSKFFNK